MSETYVPQVRETNSKEIHTIEYLACLDKQLMDGQKYLKDRLQTIPNGWRDFRLAAKATERVLDAVYETVPDKTRLHMQRIEECGQVVIRPNPAIKLPGDVQMVMVDDLLMLINSTIASECAVCLKDKREQKKCKLRKALMNIAPPRELPKNGLCVYSEVAAQNELGKYI